MSVVAACGHEKTPTSSARDPARLEPTVLPSITAPIDAAASPQSGAPLEPQSGAPLEPQSGAPLEPQSGAPLEPRSDEPPAPLACIARYYVGHPERRGDDWFLVLPDGSSLPYDDHLVKDAVRAFEAPDLEDMYSPRYVLGPIGAITDPNQDPGRNRVDALFAATYGRDAREVQASLVPWTILGAKYPVHGRVKPALDRVTSHIAALVRQDPSLAAYFHGMGGTFVWRTIAGSQKVSTHAYGIAVDIATAHAHYWRNARTPKWQNAIPASIVNAFESEGFIWGGRWFHFDTMHFEYRPELLDPTCQPTAP